MSRVITRNAHASTHANSELLGATPPDLPNTLSHDNPLVPPITGPPVPVHPSHTEGHEDNQENPLPRNNAGGPSGPNGDPDPSDDAPDGDDRDERSTEEPNNEDPFEATEGPTTYQSRTFCASLAQSSWNAEVHLTSPLPHHRIHDDSR